MSCAAPRLDAGAPSRQPRDGVVGNPEGEALFELGKPTIARVNGTCLGGGVGLMLGCDLVVASEDATFGTPEIKVGLFPMMIMASIFRNVPRRKGLELVLLGKRFTASEACAMGLINEAVPPGDLDARVQALAEELASKPPHAMRLGLEAFARQGDMALEEALPYLQDMLGRCFTTPDFQEGIQAFLQKRAPQWRPEESE